MRARIPEKDYGMLSFDSIPDQLSGKAFSDPLGPKAPKAENKAVVFATLLDKHLPSTYFDMLDETDSPNLSIEGFAARKIGGVWYFSDKSDDVDLVKAEIIDQPLDVINGQSDIRKTLFDPSSS